MTSPGGSAGELHIDVHANTDPVDPELQAGLRKATKGAEKVMDAAGETLGKELADSTSEELGKHGKDFGDAISGAVKKKKILVDGEWFTFSEKSGRWHNSMGRFARNLGEEMADEMADGLKKASSSGGVFSKAGEAISDAIGAGFNVSGRSPLVGLLIPAIGAIVTAVFGAIQAVNGLSAALVAVPPLIAAIGLQVATVAIAFDGVGEAMSNAFNAKNATELKEALKGLTPAAQDFVKSMLPVRDMFTDLKKIIQENFFQGLGNTVAPMLRSLIEITKGPFADLARALGGLFGQLATFFDSKVFATFVTTIMPATVSWLEKFGPFFVGLMEALTRMATVAIPFLSKLGDMLNKVFLKVTNRINAAVEDGSLERWLDEMLETLATLGKVFGDIIGFVKDFMGAVSEAGGNKALATIGSFFEDMGEFFSSPVGIEALQGMIGAAIVLTRLFEGLIFVIGALFALVSFAARAIAAFLEWLFGTALPAVFGFFASIGEAIHEVWVTIQTWFAELISGFLRTLKAIGRFFVDLWNGVQRGWNEFVEWVRGLPGRILKALGDLGRLLWDAGKKIIKGLWDGMVDMWNQAKGWLATIADDIVSIKGPLDYDKVLLVPAGEAIMGGLEQGMENKIKDVLGLAAGLTNTLASINSMDGIGISVPKMDAMSLSATQVVNLNMGGLNFDGTPTPDQARSAGSAAAGGMMSQIRQRDTRLAVRMM